jgi:hypothetical protein
MIENETAQHAVVEAVDESAEAQLVDEVATLWRVHSQAHTSLKKTRDELKSIRTDLSRRLYELKGLLARPGGGGTWSGFLAARVIHVRRLIDWSCNMRRLCHHGKTTAPMSD